MSVPFVSDWGNVLSESGSFAKEQPFRYAGYYWDEEVGMYYLINRYYNPQFKWFISPDPLANKDDNRYVYAANDPVNASDPAGLRTRLII